QPPGPRSEQSTYYQYHNHGVGKSSLLGPIFLPKWIEDQEVLDALPLSQRFLLPALPAKTTPPGGLCTSSLFDGRSSFSCVHRPSWPQTHTVRLTNFTHRQIYRMKAIRCTKITDS